MELPSDILSIIKEYARPITRPDWRYLHKMTECSFYTGLSHCCYYHPNGYHDGLIRIRNIWVECTDDGFFHMCHFD
jgi:hypothetical protein